MKRLLLALVAALSLAVSPVAYAAAAGALARAIAKSCSASEFDATCIGILALIGIPVILFVGMIIYFLWTSLADFAKSVYAKFTPSREKFVPPNDDLIEAATWGDVEAVRYAHSQRAEPDKPNQEGETPLMIAAFHGHTEVVKMLLLMGANPHAKNRKGDTALDYAKVGKHSTIITILEMMGIQ